MNYNDDTCGTCTALGGILAALVIASLFFKWMKNFWIELGRAFTAFGDMTGSFISMLWNIFQVVSLISATVAILACAIYFTIKYFEMVRFATDLQEQAKHKLLEYQNKMTAEIQEVKQGLRAEMDTLNQALAKALAKPEVAPPLEEPKLLSIAGNNREEVNDDNGEVESEDLDEDEPNEFYEDDNEQDDEIESPEEESIPMSNPY